MATTIRKEVLNDAFSLEVEFPVKRIRIVTINDEEFLDLVDSKGVVATIPKNSDTMKIKSGDVVILKTKGRYSNFVEILKP